MEFQPLAAGRVASSPFPKKTLFLGAWCLMPCLENCVRSKALHLSAFKAIISCPPSPLLLCSKGIYSLLSPVSPLRLLFLASCWSLLHLVPSPAEEAVTLLSLPCSPFLHFSLDPTGFSTVMVLASATSGHHILFVPRVMPLT